MKYLFAALAGAVLWHGLLTVERHLLPDRFCYWTGGHLLGYTDGDQSDYVCIHRYRLR